MNDIYVGDLVINVDDHNVVGRVLPTTDSAGGLHSAANIDVSDIGTGPRFSDSGRVPVRWNTDDGVSYEWWESPEFLEMVRPALDRSQLAVH